MKTLMYLMVVCFLGCGQNNAPIDASIQDAGIDVVEAGIEGVGSRVIDADEMQLNGTPCPDPNGYCPGAIWRRS